MAKLAQLDTLFVFGDSYSDAGNSGLLTQNIPPFLDGFPPLPYADGRVSNGPVAVEQLWSLVNPSAPPLRPSLAGGTNYAVNGATTGRESQFSVDTTPAFAPVRPAFAKTSAFYQLNEFLVPPKTFQPNNTLFVIWLGANDGLYWLKTQSAPGIGSTPGTITGGAPAANSTPADLINNAVANLEQGIQTLINAGASHILVPNLLDMSLAPSFNADPLQAFLIRQLVLGFNTRLAQTLTDLSAANPQVDLMPFDMFALFNDIHSQPASYGLTNVSDRCVVDLAIVPACNPDQWFFWDSLHPTTKGHSLIAQAMFQQVPGPLPLVGAAAAFGWSRRLRRRLRTRACPVQGQTASGGS
ncbi:MAG: SGNH/GDSL hydrolase family protein [Cyanobacteriota bacterium]|nr:SGNH/GDSL hydrolase family protein [Cyanobacteriota bacterium]